MGLCFDSTHNNNKIGVIVMIAWKYVQINPALTNPLGVMRGWLLHVNEIIMQNSGPESIGSSFMHVHAYICRKIVIRSFYSGSAYTCINHVLSHKM